MNLTIAELVQAVDKSENYIRQHIHRKHLIVQKDGRNGRNVSVALDEAMRWASERGLPFNLPARASGTMGATEDRTARMTVLTWHAPDAQPCNLFTLIRHRRKDALGPWASEPDETWSSFNLGHELRLFSLDASFERCQELVNHILDTGTLEIDSLEISSLGIHYALESIPRRHWAYRDKRPLADASVLSPFERYSAETIEYWSFTAEPRKHWLKVLKSLQGKTPPQLARLGFPLARRLDRVGNLMIAAAQDTIACELAVNRNQTLVFHVDADELLPGEYRASVWASHSGDEVLRREVPVALGRTVIELVSDIDHIGFAIFRTADGQCVDLMEVFLIMEASVRVEIQSGPTLHLRNRQSRATHTVNPSGSVSMINVHSDDDSAELDKEIRRLWLDRQVHEREAAARREGNFARFSPDEFDEAVQYFISLLHQGSDHTGPIYLADRYFMKSFSRAKKERLEQLYLKMFAATTGRPLRILCTERGNGNVQPWWSNYPNLITDHVKVRAFLKQDRSTPGFHDRYLITPEREILITHSLNGWPEGGVTFARLPYDIYRAEAELLWSTDIGSNNTDFFVEEIA